jgi:hypothetical protein
MLDDEALGDYRFEALGLLIQVFLPYGMMN